MRRAYRFACCAVLAMVPTLLPSVGRAQFGENPFEPAKADRDTGPFDAPELTPEPIPIVDPAPADDIALPAVADTRATPDQSFCRCIGEGASSPSIARIHDALRSPLKPSGLDFHEQSLQDVVAMLQEEYNIPIEIDATALDDLGVPTDQPVTATLHNISLRSALRLMLRQSGLTFLVEDEVLKITTPDEAERQLRVCVYDVRDLIDPSNPTDIDSLKDTVISCVATETWAANGGGEAEIRPFRQSLLVVSQTQAVHDEVRALLETIRGQLQVKPKVTAAIVPAVPQNSLSNASNIVTRCYYLQFNQQPGGESFAPKVCELIMQALPDVQWAGRLDNNEPVVLTVLPDRVVLRHRSSVQNKVESLLIDSGLVVPSAGVAGRRGFGGEGGGYGGGGFGGGGGFFNPQP